MSGTGQEREKLSWVRADGEGGRGRGPSEVCKLKRVDGIIRVSGELQ